MHGAVVRRSARGNKSNREEVEILDTRLEVLCRDCSDLARESLALSEFSCLEKIVQLFSEKKVRIKL